MFLTADLLSSIRRRANIPNAAGVFDDTELLAISTEELRTYIVPLVMKEREDYWLYTKDVTLTTATSYPLPVRAVGGKLRELSVLDANGREFNVPRVSPADLQGARYGFYMDGRGIRLFLRDNQPPTSMGVTLRMRYFLRPSALIKTTDAATITDLSAWPAVTLSGGYGGLTTPGTFDCVALGSPFNVKEDGFAGTLVGTTLTTSGATLANFAVGDWICDEDQSPVVQAPIEFHDILAQKVAVKVLESKGMTEKLGSAREELGRMEADASALISPRVDGETQRAVGRGGLFRMRW